MRIRCYLFGCREDEDGYCHYCESYLYMGYALEGVLEKPLDAMWRFWWRLKTVTVGRKCEICGKRFWRSFNRNEFVCSEECAKDWVPF